MWSLAISRDGHSSDALCGRDDRKIYMAHGERERESTEFKIPARLVRVALTVTLGLLDVRDLSAWHPAAHYVICTKQIAPA